MAVNVFPLTEKYAKRPVPEPAKLSDWLTRELGIVERAIRDSSLTPSRTVEADLLATTADGLLVVDATDGNVEVRLPVSRPVGGKLYYVKKSDATANTVTITPNGTETIDGAASEVLGAQNESVILIARDGSWTVLGQANIVPPGAITGSGTINTLAMFTAASVIGDSLLSQSGANVTVNGNVVSNATGTRTVGSVANEWLAMYTQQVAAIGQLTLLAGGTSSVVLNAGGTGWTSLSNLGVLNHTGSTVLGDTTSDSITLNGVIGGGGTIADLSAGSAILKNSALGSDFAGGPFRITRAAATPTASLRYAGSTGTLAVPVAPSGNLAIGQVVMQGWDSTSSLYVDGARVLAESNNTWTATNRQSILRLQNILDGTTTLRDGIRLESSGALRFLNDTTETYGVFFGNSWDITRNTDTAASFPAYSLVRTRGTRLSEAVVQNGDALGQYQWSGWNGGYYVSTVIQSFATELWNAGASGSSMLLRVTANGAVTPTTVLTLLSGSATFNATLATGGNIGLGTAAVTQTGLTTAGTLSGSTTQRVFQASSVFGSGATDFAQAFRATPTFTSASYTTTNYAAFYAPNVAAGGGGHVITNWHGLYVEVPSGGTNNYAIRTLGGQVVFNDNANAEADVRMEGDTLTSLFHLDTSTDRIGINTATPGYLLDVNGVVNAATSYNIAGTKVVGAQGAAVTDPTGGVVIDAEARTAIIAINDRLQAHGLIA